MRQLTCSYVCNLLQGIHFGHTGPLVFIDVAKKYCKDLYIRDLIPQIAKELENSVNNRSNHTNCLGASVLGSSAFSPFGWEDTPLLFEPKTDINLATVRIKYLNIQITVENIIDL